MDIDEQTEDAGLRRDRFLRATIARGELTLNPPLRGTIRGGPASMTLARLDGVVLVDLRHAGEDDEELVATPPPNAPPSAVRPGACSPTGPRSWATAALWLPDAVVDLEPPPPVGTATRAVPDVRVDVVGRLGGLLGGGAPQRPLPRLLPRVRRLAAGVEAGGGRDARRALVGRRRAARRPTAAM